MNILVHCSILSVVCNTWSIAATCVGYIENNVCTGVRYRFSAHERCLFPELRSNEGNKYQNNT